MSDGEQHESNEVENPDLRLATLDQIMDELGRRYVSAAIVIDGVAPGCEDEPGAVSECLFHGNVFTLYGMLQWAARVAMKNGPKA